MKYFFIKPIGVKKFRGKKRATIVTTINRDIIRTRERFPEFDVHPLKSELDLWNVRVKAKNRNH